MLKQVGLNKSPGLDGLPYEVYLRMSHMFVTILTDMFNHWFAQGAIPGSVTKGVITLLKKGGKHVWEGLNDYRPITLLNTELKILARVLANRLQLVISDLIGPEQTFAVKGRSTKDNLHLIRAVLEGIEDDTEAALISLDQSKAFDRDDHRFLATVLETAGFEPGFRRWISMMYHNPQAVVQMNGRRSRAFAIERSVWQGCPLSPLLYVLALEPLLRRLRDEGTSPALRGVPFTGPLTARVSAFADDITVFVSHRLDIKAVKESSGLQEPRLILTKAKVCGSVLGGVAILFRALPLECRTRPHPRAVVRVRHPTGAKLVGSTNQGECSGGKLAFKEVVLKRQGGGVRRVRLPLYPLPIGCTSSA